MGQAGRAPAELRPFADARGLGFDAMNSNTFQDQPGQALSYKFGSLTPHRSRRCAQQAIEHNLECIEIGQKLGAQGRTPSGSATAATFPGQMHFRRALERYLDSAARRSTRALPDDWRLFIEHKLYEPAFYSTVHQRLGHELPAARASSGPQALCLVDLGHHAPNVNIEMIVARLIQFGKLGGFHFNDSKYGDDDLDAGSIKPVPALPGLQRAGRRRARAACRASTRPTCSTSRTTSPIPIES